MCERACTAGQIVLKSSKTHHFNKFEKGNRDEFFVEVDNIGQLKHIRYLHCVSKNDTDVAH